MVRHKGKETFRQAAAFSLRFEVKHEAILSQYGKISHLWYYFNEKSRASKRLEELERKLYYQLWLHCMLLKNEERAD